MTVKSFFSTCRIASLSKIFPLKSFMKPTDRSVDLGLWGEWKQNKTLIAASQRLLATSIKRSSQHCVTLRPFPFTPLVFVCVHDVISARRR